MFGFLKPPYEKLRQDLPVAYRPDFDSALSTASQLVPSWWEMEDQKRTLTLVMSRWIQDTADRQPMPASLIRRAEHFEHVTRIFNDKTANGFAATLRATEIIGQMREAGLYPD